MAEATREVIYRGPAEGGLNVDERVLYPGDITTMSDRRIGTLMRTGGHRFQNVGGDIVRPYELDPSRKGAVGEQEAADAPPTKPEDAERDARLVDAQAAAQALDAAPDTLTANAAAAAGDTKPGKPKKP